MRIRGPTKEDSNVPVDLVIRSVVARRHSKPETLSSLGDLPKLPLSSVPWDEDNAYILGCLGRFEVVMHMQQWDRGNAQKTLGVSWCPMFQRHLCPSNPQNVSCLERWQQEG